MEQTGQNYRLLKKYEFKPQENQTSIQNKSDILSQISCDEQRQTTTTQIRILLLDRAEVQFPYSSNIPLTRLTTLNFLAMSDGK